MIKKLICKLLSLFTIKYRKFGFTLAEALIITVMTGACLLPILGTMQNAQVRTENFDHQSKMQQYARSRLNAEIANAAFDHKSINLEDEYHYIVYFDEKGNSEDAKKIELTRTSINKEDLKALDKAEVKTKWSDEACRIFGIKKIDNANKPFVKVIHAYKTSVETKDNPTLAEFGDDTKIVDTPKALLGLVIKTSLLESDDNQYDSKGYLIYSKAVSAEGGETVYESVKDETTQIVPVTLFSFVNLPVVSDEMIWLADAYNIKIYGVDPIGKSVTAPLDLPYNKALTVDDSGNDQYRPWHLAVQPSLKYLAVMREKTIDLIDIDKKSSTFGKIFNNDNVSLTFAKSISKDGTQAYTDGALVFRPDGKFLFAYSSSNYLLFAYELSYNNNEPKLSEIANYNFAGVNVINKMVPANDGNLYIGLSGSKIVKIPMYQSDWTKWEPVFFKDINSLTSFDISHDGSRIAVISNGQNLSLYNTKDGNVINNIENIVIKNIKSDSVFQQASDLAFASLSDSEGEIFDDKNLKVILTNAQADANGKILVESVYGKATSLIEELSNKTKESIKSGKIVVSPDNRTYLINNLEKALAYIGTTVAKSSSEELNNSDEKAIEFSKQSSFSDIVSTKRDILAVAEGSDKKTIQLYDINTFKKLEEEYVKDNEAITSLAMNPHGDTLITGHGEEKSDGTGKGATAFSRINLGDLTIQTVGSGYGKKAVFDDRTPNMVFTLKYPDGTGDNKLAFQNINSINTDDDWETDDSYTRKVLNLHSSWKRLDMIGMPQGGAMVLYGKDDGSSMIEWIGRRNWKQEPNDKKGQYKLFARWVSNKPVSKIPEEIPSFSSGDYDSTPGNLIVEISQCFPCGSVVKKMSFNKLRGGSGVITPLILQKVSYNKYKIIDVVESTVTVPIPQASGSVNLSWQNGGTVVENCYMGFWFGDLGDTVGDGKKAGAIPYSTLSTDAGSDYTFYCDSTINGNWATKDDVIIGAEVTLSNNAIYDKLSGSEHLYRREYNIQFEAENNGLLFPPTFSKKLAISPDCGTLAVLSGVNGGDSFLNLYDFNNQIYGPETQIEGLLVDYRVPLNSRDRDDHIYPDHNWPEETDLNYFGKVQTNCNFSNIANCINTFPLATTKHETWKNYNDYPANYLVHSSEDVVNGAPNSYNKLDPVHKNKSDANKRFFGYFRPEYKVTKLQTGAEDDFRFFLNNSFLWGRVDSWSGTFVIMGREGISSSKPVPDSSSPLVQAPLDFFVNPNESALFQYDIASNKGAQFSSLFVSSYSAAFKNFWYAFNDSRNKVNLNFNLNSPLSAIIEKKSNDFNYINSSETYILKNQPVFIGSFKAKTTGGDVLLNPDSTSMVFSRDRAKPVLYLADKEDLWAFYKHGIIRFYNNASMNINTNLSISGDGQKLIMGLGDKSLKIFNISNPDNTVFNDSTNKEVTFDSTGNDVISVKYLTSKDSFSSLIKTIPLTSIPSYLATKPYVSYKSSSLGGDYNNISYALEEITSVSPINHNNVCAVASGGIYIFADNNKIYFYNPLTNKLNLKGEMKKKSPYCPMTVYDDILYVFGCGKGEGEPEFTNRVQSFNTKTDEAIFSLDGATDPSAPVSYFRANLYYNNYNKNALIIDRDKEEGHNKAKNAFNNEDSVWKSTDSTGWISYEVNYDYPFIANAIIIDNKVTMPYGFYPYYRCIGVKHFILWGINYDASGNEKPPVKLLEDDMPWYSRKDFYMPTNTTAYKKYKLECKTSHDYSGVSGRKVAVKNIYFFRTGVGLLTPSGGWTVDTTNKYIRNDKNSSNPLRVFCSNSTSGLNSLPRIFHDSESNSFTFDVDCSNPLSNAYVKFSFENNKVKLSAIRLCNQYSNHSYITGFKLYGNTDDCEDPSDESLKDADSSSWELINEFTNLPGSYGYVTYELSPSKSYKHYLFKISSYSGGSGNGQVIINQMQLWEDTVAALMGEDASNDYLTPMVNDNLQELKSGYGAACATPYGLVYTGGKESDSSVINSALLYWSHAVNKYDGKYKQFGIPRSLPIMNSPRMQHSMVWHKGKIYVIGGTTKTDDKSGIIAKESFFEYLDYNKEMLWIASDVSKITLVNGATENECRRFNHGCVSFGDEIFVFGGKDTGGTTKTAYAWNPEANLIRKINDMPDKLFPCSAVVFGSKIYIVGMNENSEFKMFEYTP